MSSLNIEVNKLEKREDTGKDFEAIKSDVGNIQLYLKDKFLSDFIDYKLEQVIFSRFYTEKELENKFNIFFCNGLSEPINSATLVYSSYDALLSIVPDGDHDSYFNMVNVICPEDHNGIEYKNYETKIFNLWNELKSI